MSAEPALFMILLVVIAGIGTVCLAGTLVVEERKVLVHEQKQRDTQSRIEALRKRRQQQAAERKVAKAVEARDTADGSIDSADAPLRDRS